MLFEEVIEQDYPTQVLRNSLKRKKLSHAYIFIGPEGVGKQFLAKKLAQAVNCRTYEICNNCDDCKAIEINCYPDIKIIKPLSTTISVNQIRELRREISFKPLVGRKKIFIIAQSEVLTEEAQNALLKILEEPLGEAILILITTNINNLKKTIISRCQILKFKPISILAIKKILINNYALEEKKAFLLAKISDGNLKKAQDLISPLKFSEREKLLEKGINFLKIEKTDELFKEVEEIAKFKKENIIELLEYLILFFHDLLILKYTYNKNLIINLDKLSLEEEIQTKLDKYFSLEILEIIDIIIDTKKKLLDNINVKLALEGMWLKIRKNKYV